MTTTIERDGFVILPHVLNADACDALIAALDAAQEGSSVRRCGNVYAMRNLLDIPAVAALAQSPAVRALIEPILGPEAFAVRGILFDKTPDANWKVVWHQGLSIAVRERREVDSFGPWSEKAGVTHVQPPVAVLERMLAVRLHLDECDAANGPVRIIPGSHHSGRLNADAISRRRAQHADVFCLVPRGGALLMRPLLLHASSASQTPRHRRVIHLEFAAERLPDGLEWYATTQHADV